MKAFLALVITIVSVNVFASDKCVSEAVSAAKRSAFRTSVLHAVTSFEADKNYLEQYEVVLTDSVSNPRRFETYDVTMMKSGCTAAFVTPRL